LISGKREYGLAATRRGRKGSQNRGLDVGSVNGLVWRLFWQEKLKIAVLLTGGGGLRVDQKTKRGGNGGERETEREILSSVSLQKSSPR